MNYPIRLMSLDDYDPAYRLWSAAEGIKKCNIFVMDDNPAGLKFWEHIGFTGWRIIIGRFNRGRRR